MNAPRALIFVLLAAVLGVPWLLRPPAEARRALPPEQVLVVVTPHVPQIQREFARAFDLWHQRVHGTPVHVDWRQPGGTSDIMKVLDAAYAAQASAEIERRQAQDSASLRAASLTGDALIPERSMAIDVMLGGGSYEHGQLKEPLTTIRVRAWKGLAPAEIEILPPPQRLTRAALAGLKELTTDAVILGETCRVVLPTGALTGGEGALLPLAEGAASVRATADLARIDRVLTIRRSAPTSFTREQLDAWYGVNEIGAGVLYDPDQYWLGTALSGFGIVYNKDLLHRLHLPEPDSFDALGDPSLAGNVALADPRQSGSVTTTLDAILSYYGWEKGWRLLREMCGNARSFANSSPKPPIDVSHGEAAVGLAIDFYGRGQGQAVLLPGQDPSEGRVGYVDPKGATYIDADPVSVLRGGPNPVLASRFVEFCLSDEAQALWQFHALEINGVPNPRAANNPKGPDGRPMGPLNYELRRMPVRRRTYEAYSDAFVDRVNPFEVASRTRPAGWRSAIPIMMGAFGIDTWDDCRAAWRALNAARRDPSFSAPTLAEMERLFYAFPPTTTREGKTLDFSPANYKAVAAVWRDPASRSRCEIDYTSFFRANYRRIVELSRGVGPR